MNDRLTRWMVRSRPDTSRIIAALVLSLFAGAASITLFGGSGLLVGKAAGGGGLAVLGGLLVLIEIVAFLRAPLRYEERMVTHRVALGSMVRWRLWLYDIVATKSPGSLSFLSTGELLDRSIEDIDLLEDLYVRVVLPIVAALMTGLLAAGVIAIWLPLGGLVVALCVLGGLVVSLALGHAAVHPAQHAAALRSLISSKMVDTIEGSAELRMTNLGGQLHREIEELDAHCQRQEVLVARMRAFGVLAIGCLNAAGVLGVTLLAAAHVHHGSLTPGEAAGISLASLAGLEPLLGALAGALAAAHVDAAAARLEALESAPASVIEASHPVQWPSRTAPLSFRSVSSAPSAGAPAVVRNVSLVIDPGARIAIIGASGSGKTTLCRLALRFLDPLEGSVAIGATAYLDMASDDVRHHVVLLDQDPILFAGTLGDALRLGDPLATDEALLAIIATVDLGELATSPEDLALSIGESGATLSLGQQRRVALARAMLRRPDILLLDEPTAGLDPEQGRRILSDVLSAAGDAAVVLVTHDDDAAQMMSERYWLYNGELSKVSN
jgi:ABC-type transport system involved in cytochrome bd biosynthesis fused ATPase/permease subunit